MTFPYWMRPPEEEESLLGIIDLIAAGKYSQAQELIRERLRADEDRIDLLLLLSETRQLAGETGESVKSPLLGAMEVFDQRWQEIQPDLPWYYWSVQLIATIAKSGERTWTLEAAERLGRMRPRDSRSALALAGMWITVDQPDQARQTLEDVKIDRLDRQLKLALQIVIFRRLGRTRQTLTLTRRLKRRRNLEPEVMRLLENDQDPIDVSYKVLLNALGREEKIDPTESTQWKEQTQQVLMREIAGAGLTFRRANESVPDGFLAKQDWLDKVVARAQEAESQLKLVPRTVSILKHESIMILMTTDHDYVHGFFSVHGRGIPVSIRIKDWQCFGDTQDGLATAAFGLVILWFLDCSLRSHGCGEGHFVQETEFSWRVTDAFTAHVLDVRRYILEPQHVRGHVRTLSDGRTPSSEAVSNAPSHLQRHMAPNQTFVKSHQRNGESDGRFLLGYLRRTSNVADGLSLLFRHSRRAS